MDRKIENSRWDNLSKTERLKLRREYDNHLEHKPPGYVTDSTIDRFCIWLNKRGIRYEP